MSLLVDSREPLEVVYQLRAMGIEVERRLLEVGDYVIGDLVIERKTLSNFLQDVFSKRLWFQVEELSHRRSLLVVVGYPIENDKIFWGAIAGILRWGVSVICLPPESFHFYSLLAALERQAKKEKRISLPPIRKKTKLTKGEILVYMLGCIPGLGYVKAKMLVEKFGNMHNICHASRKELKSLRGFGDKLAGKIKSILFES